MGPSPALRSVRTSGHAARVFAAQPSPRIVAAAVAVGLVRRVRAGRPATGDALAAGAVLASRGLHEYVIHRWLLHAPRRTVRGMVIDPGVGHRAHHEDPDALRPAFIPPARAAAFVALLAAYVDTIGRVAGLPVATRRTAVAAAWAALLAYEWRHVVDHTSVPLRSSRTRALRAHHRAHHYADERRDLGITSRAGDRVAAWLAPPVSPRGAARR